MRIERPLNNFCRGGQLLHDAMQRQTERDIKRMRRWAEEDERSRQKLKLEYIESVIDMIKTKYPDAEIEINL